MHAKRLVYYSSVYSKKILNLKFQNKNLKKLEIFFTNCNQTIGYNLSQISSLGLKIFGLNRIKEIEKFRI